MTEAELYSVHEGVYVPTHLHPPESLKYYEEFTFRQDDILIVTYPKSGEFLSFCDAAHCNSADRNKLVMLCVSSLTLQQFTIVITFFLSNSGGNCNCSVLL